MAVDWSTLKSAVADVIKANGNQEITGQLLQSVLNNIITSLGKNATFAGIATPTTNPGLPDGPVFYFATVAGTYANFSGKVLEQGLHVLYNTVDSWQVHSVMTVAQEAGDSNSVVMSQKAVTDAIVDRTSVLSDTLDNLIKETVSFPHSGFIDKNTGDVVYNPDYVYTNLVRVSKEDRIFYRGAAFDRGASVAFYAADKSYISSVQFNVVGTYEVEIPENTFYIKGSTSLLTLKGEKPILYIKTNIHKSLDDLQAGLGNLNHVISALSGVQHISYELRDGFYNSVNGGFNKYSQYKANVEPIPVEEGWLIGGSNFACADDRATSIIFYDAGMNMIGKVKQMIMPFVQAPVGSKFFNFTLMDDTFGEVFVAPAIYKDVIEEFSDVNDTIALLNKSKVGDYTYGELTTPKNNYTDTCILLAERPYTKLPIRVTSISFHIGDLSDWDAYVEITAAEKTETGVFFPRHPKHFDVELKANSINTVPVDYILYPNQALTVFVTGGIVKWGGAATGYSNYFSARYIGKGGVFETNIYKFAKDGKPSANSGDSGNFLSFTYELYDEKEDEDKPIKNFLTNKVIGVVGDSESVTPFFNVTWAKEPQDRAKYSIFGASSGHWSTMIAKRVGAELDNKGISGTFVFGTNTTDGTDSSVIGQLQRLRKDIDYLIVFSGTNGTNLRDKNGVIVSTLGDINSPVLSGAPTTIDSTQETMTIYGAMKWLIEYIYGLFPNVKLGFITPWEYQTRNPDGTYTLSTLGKNGRLFATVIREVCQLYSVRYFDNVKDSGICWFNDAQRHALMGSQEIVPSISEIKNFKIGPKMGFYVKDENSVYEVDTADADHIPLTWHKIKENSTGGAYGDSLHISNTNGMRFLSYKYEEFIKSL